MTEYEHYLYNKVKKSSFLQNLNKEEIDFSTKLNLNKIQNNKEE